VVRLVGLVGCGGETGELVVCSGETGGIGRVRW